MNQKAVLTTAWASIAALLTLAFLYYIFPGHFVYSRFHDSDFIRERTDVFSGKVNLQVLDISKGEWVNH